MIVMMHRVMMKMVVMVMLKRTATLEPGVGWIDPITFLFNKMCIIAVPSSICNYFISKKFCLWEEEIKFPYGSRTPYEVFVLDLRPCVCKILSVFRKSRKSNCFDGRKSSSILTLVSNVRKFRKTYRKFSQKSDL